MLCSSACGCIILYYCSASETQAELSAVLSLIKFKLFDIQTFLLVCLISPCDNLVITTSTPSRLIQLPDIFKHWFEALMLRVIDL